MHKMPKNAEKYICENCDFKCSKKSNYDIHLTTLKHKNRTKLNNLEPFCDYKSKEFLCKYCEKSYKARNSLWYHEQKCKSQKIDIKMNEPDIDNTTLYEKELTDKDLIISLLKQNAELLEIVKNGTHNTINNNCHNKTFNLQVFLNETCKDAMNIMDFVDSIKLQLSDLESVGELGYVKGMSNIIVKNLKALDVTKRPVHCSDVKREVLYIKDNDKWEKEDPENNKLRKAIKYISHKNILLLSKWREKYPDSQCSDSPQSDKYHHMVMEAMGGDGNDTIGKENKIIRNIAREVMIEK